MLAEKETHISILAVRARPPEASVLESVLVIVLHEYDKSFISRTCRLLTKYSCMQVTRECVPPPSPTNRLKPILSPRTQVLYACRISLFHKVRLPTRWSVTFRIIICPVIEGAEGSVLSVPLYLHIFHLLTLPHVHRWGATCAARHASTSPSARDMFSV
jgi:hypothetical protein